MNQEVREFPGIENEYSIQTFGITKCYKERTAVNGINLGIKRGELFSLLGPNGAGFGAIRVDFYWVLGYSLILFLLGVVCFQVRTRE